MKTPYKSYQVLVQWKGHLGAAKFFEEIRASLAERSQELVIANVQKTSPNRPRGVIRVDTQLSEDELMRVLRALELVEKVEVEKQWRKDL